MKLIYLIQDHNESLTIDELSQRKTRNIFKVVAEATNRGVKAIRKVTSDRLLTTNSSGNISLVKSDDEFPQLQDFQNLATESNDITTTESNEIKEELDIEALMQRGLSRVQIDEAVAMKNSLYYRTSSPVMDDLSPQVTSLKSASESASKQVFYCLL